MSERHCEVQSCVPRRVERRRVVPRTAHRRVADAVLVRVVVGGRVVRVEEVLAVHADVQTRLPKRKILATRRSTSVRRLSAYRRCSLSRRATFVLPPAVPPVGCVPGSARRGCWARARLRRAPTAAGSGPPRSPARRCAGWCSWPGRASSSGTAASGGSRGDRGCRSSRQSRTCHRSCGRCSYRTGG
jgi:hypothetical protein